MLLELALVKYPLYFRGAWTVAGENVVLIDIGDCLVPFIQTSPFQSFSVSPLGYFQVGPAFPVFPEDSVEYLEN